MEWLLLSLQFTGRVSVVVQNGRVLKSGYEGKAISARTVIGSRDFACGKNLSRGEATDFLLSDCEDGK
jgi:hypothetical protein